jgi:hypothetical protein
MKCKRHLFQYAEMMYENRPLETLHIIHLIANVHIYYLLRAT